MAKAAYLCVQRSPEMRPSMGEVIKFHLLDFYCIVPTKLEEDELISQASQFWMSTHAFV